MASAYCNDTKIVAPPAVAYDAYILIRRLALTELGIEAAGIPSKGPVV